MTLLLTGALALMLGTALLYGFTGIYPRFRSPAIKGVALFTLGIAAIWVPLSFVVAAFLVAQGTRMIWLEACRLNQKEVEVVHPESVNGQRYPRHIDSDRDSLPEHRAGVPARR